jgi:hypothetical protein
MLQSFKIFNQNIKKSNGVPPFKLVKKTRLFEMDNRRKAVEIRAAQLVCLFFCLHFTACFYPARSEKSYSDIKKHLTSTFQK